jgi:hypothetical protein
MNQAKHRKTNINGNVKEADFMRNAGTIRNRRIADQMDEYRENIELD